MVMELNQDNINKFEFFVWNSNGLNYKKIQYIISLMKITKLNIIILIETHFNDISFNWKRWNVVSLPNKKKKKTKGFYILIKKKIKYKIHIINSRCLNLKLEMKNNIDTYYLNILIIYGHASNGRDIDWWKNLNISNYNIILGDFNLVLDNNRDRINTNAASK